MIKKIGRLPFIQKILGFLLAGYLLFVRITSRSSKLNDMDSFNKLKHHAPFIATFWHGQHFLISFLPRKGFTISTLISKHKDGEINAIAAGLLGIKAVRGSGDTKNKGTQKGGMVAFRTLMRLLKQGECVASTADVPKISGVAGEGILLLAQKSGRPILPVAYATSRYKTLSSWDKASLHLPFSTLGYACGEPIYIDPNSSQEERDVLRKKLEETLHNVTYKAYENAGGSIPEHISVACTQ